MIHVKIEYSGNAESYENEMQLQKDIETMLKEKHPKCSFYSFSILDPEYKKATKALLERIAEHIKWGL